MPELKYIPLDAIRGNPVALRDVNRQSEEFMELVGSIKRDGVFNAINVRHAPGEDGKQYVLVDGLQRFTGSCEAGTGVVENGQGVYDKDAKGEVRTDSAGRPVGLIPAQVISRDDAEALTSQIIANAHRIETKPVEYSRAIMRYLGYNPTLTESELAARLNKSPQWVNKMLGLLKLSDAAKPLVNEGKIPLASAYALAKLPPDEQANWLERAQTMQSTEFNGQALARVKEIRDSNRKGQQAGEEQFIPVTHLRKKPEIEKEMQQPEILPNLLRDLKVTNGIKPNAEGLQQAALEGAKVALKWALNFDEKSIEEAKKKDADRRAREKEQKIRRDAEKTQTKAKEAAERAEKARAAAEEARKAAEALPPEQQPAPAGAPA